MKRDSSREVIGLIPAGGEAKRIAPLPCSKEIYPVGLHDRGEPYAGRPKVVGHYLLEKMRSAGVSRAFFILRAGKWDIPAYFGDGSTLKMPLGYLMLGQNFGGVPFTLDQAYPFVRDAVVAFGFPDILFDADDGFGRLLEWNSEHQADISLGLFPAAGSMSREDRIIQSDAGIVRDILLGPEVSDVRYSWAIAVWKPSFTEFLHEYTREKRGERQSPELSAGHAIRAAVVAGMRVDSIVVDEKPFLDIGTPEGLQRAISR